MKKFPNKIIELAYKDALGKVFTKKTATGAYKDQDCSENYNYVAMNWLEDHGILHRTLNRYRFVLNIGL